jgi:hypothetical protein
MYQIDAGAGPVRGYISLRGQQMFFLSGHCLFGVGRYRWTLRHHRLHFYEEGHDVCVNRAGALIGRTFRHVGRNYRPA